MQATPQSEIPPPANAQEFGNQVLFLDNGNFVVTAPGYDLPGAADVGAVFLYRVNGTLISTLTGSTAGDRVGDGQIVKLRNGHFVVRSYSWGPTLSTRRAGAVTWVNANSGLNGVVSASNSLVGSAMDDVVGGGVGVLALSNGHYVVSSCQWSGVSPTQAFGAVTWGNGNGGTVGEVGPSNSLTGSSLGDGVGCRVYVSANGHYVAAFPFWNNAATADAGAVAWGNGLGGTVGTLSATNALVGTSADDYVGIKVVVLQNGNFVTAASGWDDISSGLEVNSGAVTWMRGTGPTTGVVSINNSLIGLNPGDQVGSSVTALSNGHYVMSSPNWDNLATVDVGAVTWGNGVTGSVGHVDAGNSLLGTQAGDRIGSRDAVALSNGHYAVASSDWSAGATPAVGAITWANGNGPRTGQVSAGNSLIGTNANDRVGFGDVVALTNGHFVVISPTWDYLQTADVGAVTWRNGSGPSPGVVSNDNSLIGTLASDQVGVGGITALTNGNYVVASPNVDLGTNPIVPNVGAVTWCSGTGATAGVVSTTNSFLGLLQSDFVGGGGSVVALSNGNYVAGSPFFNGFISANVGALTWGNGNVSTGAFLNDSNSLLGVRGADRVGSGGIVATSDGSYIARSPQVDTIVTDGGMITFGRSDGSTVGTVPSAISVSGATSGRGSTIVFDYDAVRERLIVGLPADNRVVISQTDPNRVFRDGFE